MFHWNGISVSEMWQLTVFWQIFVTECFLQMFHESCKNVLEIFQNWYLWQIYDSFLNQTMTIFWHIYYFWYISEAFPNLFWQNCDRYMNLTDFWQISDTIQTVFWPIFVNDIFLTDLWIFLDLHCLRVPETVYLMTNVSFLVLFTCYFSKLWVRSIDLLASPQLVTTDYCDLLCGRWRTEDAHSFSQEEPDKKWASLRVAVVAYPDRETNWPPFVVSILIWFPSLEFSTSDRRSFRNIHWGSFYNTRDAYYVQPRFSTWSAMAKKVKVLGNRHYLKSQVLTRSLSVALIFLCLQRIFQAR